MSEGQQTDPLVFILFCSDSQDIDWYRFSSTRAGCFGQWFCLSSLSFSIPLSHWRCLSVFSLSHTLSHVSTQLNFISGINFCMYIPLSLKKKRKENKEKHTVVFLNVGLKKKHVNVRFGGGFWKTKSCILCLGFRLGERLGDMLLSSCNGGQYVWWAFVITPNEFECLHELNVKVNQTLCGAEDWKWEKEGCSEYTSLMDSGKKPRLVQTKLWGRGRWDDSDQTVNSPRGRTRKDREDT